MPLSVLRHRRFGGGRSWREEAGGWCLQAPKGTRENGARSWGPSSKVYPPQCFPAVLLWLCELPELQRAPGSWCSRMSWVVGGGTPPSSSLWSLGSNEDTEVLCCGTADEVLLVLSQALLNPGWPGGGQALVVGALCPVVNRFSKRWLLRPSGPQLWL